MRQIDPLPHHHSWPLSDLRDHLAPVALDSRIARDDVALAERGLGLWHCDLKDESLSWTAGVYDLFGLERYSAVSRGQAITLYAPDSREMLEKIRAYAIRSRRGFTLDVDIMPADGGRCRMRVVAAPMLLHDGAVSGLHGVKQLLPDGAPASHRLDPGIFVML